MNAEITVSFVAGHRQTKLSKATHEPFRLEPENEPKIKKVQPRSLYKWDGKKFNMDPATRPIGKSENLVEMQTITGEKV